MSELKEGTAAPEFNGVDQNGASVSLADLSGKKVILYFYPKDDTPGCTAEACSLRDYYSELKEKGFEVIGVSADNEKKHAKFVEKYDLPFRLIADTEKEVINAYGAWGLKKFMGHEYEGIIRKTFVIDESGVIERVFDKVKTKAHAEQILESYAS
ncbi:thioredoxin-dependent thiol peroxidase [Cryomorphaceae bacterium]|nr:thioredoxin-dependent thiol peroxidase [Cryomorphaceae bacterium]